MSVNVWRIVEGAPMKVGSIDKDTGRFAYCAEYLSWADAAPVSFSLPLQSEPFDAHATKCYFDALLPEGEALSSLAARLGILRDRYIDLLERIGRDCIADLMIAPDNDAYRPRYEPIDLSHIKGLVSTSEEIARASEQSRLSLAGTQDKIGLAHLPSAEMTEGWFRPFGGAASSHVIKVARGNSTVPYIEYLCMATARLCGISTADTALVNIGNTPAVLSSRFDRVVSSGQKGLEVVRLHQEDLTQVFGLDSASKYGELEGGSNRSICSFLREVSREPVRDIEQFARVAVFNYLIGNCDAHLKNFSLLYSADWRSVNLAPAYDLVCTTRFAKYSRRLAMRFGGASFIDDVTADSFAEFADDIDVSPRMVRRIARQLSESFMPALAEAYNAAGTEDDLLWYEYDNLQADVAGRLEVLAEFAAL